jgi:hypothetical protein
MKTTLITVSVAAVALWVGYTIGYHRGAHDTFAIFRPHYSVSEVTTLHKTAINSSPDVVVFTNGVVSK